MRRLSCFAFAATIVFAIIVLPASYTSAVEIEGALEASIDIPRMFMYLQRPTESGPIMIDGEFVPAWAWLDTGTSGMLLSQETALGLGVAKLTYYNPTTQQYELNEYHDVGVGGTAVFNVSESLYVGMATFSLWSEGTNLSEYTYKSGPFRYQVATEPGGDEPIDIIGMPAMMGKVTVIDPKPLEDFFNLDVMHAYVYNPGTPFTPNNPSSPGIPTTNRHVKLSYGTFDRFSELVPTAGPGPELSHNPFIGADPLTKLTGEVDNTPGITVSFSGHSATGSFLLDTGAQLSAISSSIAKQLHVRYIDGTLGTDDPRLELYDPDHPELPGQELAEQFQAGVGGIGGSVIVAGFYLTSLGVPLMEGDSLDYLKAPVIVHDIGLEDPITHDTLTLDGIFGLNFMVASADVLGLDIHAGAFNWLVFDEPNGILGLDVKGLDPVPEPATFALLIVAAGMFFARRTLRRKIAA